MQTIHAIVNSPIGAAAVVSPTVVVPAGVTDIDAQLVLAASTPNWNSPQVAGAVWEWAVEFLNSSGNFEPLVHNVLAVGQLGKGGLLPRLGVGREGLAGMTLRGWCRCSQTVNISMDIILLP